MNLKLVFYSVGKVTKLLGALMGIPCVVSLIYRESDFLPLVISAAVTLFSGYFIEYQYIVDPRVRSLINQ